MAIVCRLLDGLFVVLIVSFITGIPVLAPIRWALEAMLRRFLPSSDRGAIEDYAFWLWLVLLPFLFAALVGLRWLCSPGTPIGV